MTRTEDIGKRAGMGICRSALWIGFDGKVAGRTLITALVMVFGIFSAARAQQFPRDGSVGSRSETFFEVPRIEGTVVDPLGKPIKDAIVSLITPSGNTLTTKSDGNGYFSLMNLLMFGDQNALTIQAPGFRRFGDRFNIRRREQLSFPVVLSAGNFTGVVNIQQPPNIDIKSSGVTARMIVN